MFGTSKITHEFTGPWGVRVQIDQSLILLVGLLVYLSLGAGFVDGVIFAGLLVLSIYLHELGHAWGCVVQKIPVRRVVLYGGGGFCERKISGTAREQELIVAMGPLVNLALWAISGLVVHFGIIWAATTLDYDNPGSRLVFEILYHVSVFGWINGALVVFNLIPVQPLDGGKLLHLALLRFLPTASAHRWTGGVGLVLSVAWIPAMIAVYLWGGWVLFFIPSIRAHLAMWRGKLAV